ncbi:hypothetical protein [uncultured Dokdonia sp.]|uniref:hypothetical protein n=1 Tax=uncultured Dokdonia sp. TaxID=575653 RepID=UPI0026169711|nr:hypothetical protein [uncultured Dokdonia sp.]
MLKKIENLGKTLSKDSQREVNGGMLSEVTCNNPYINPGGPCDQGYYPHPTLGHCVCCAY